METEWVIDRVQLYRLMRQEPTWSIQRLANALGRSASWVKKWRKRLRAVLDGQIAHDHLRCRDR